MSASSNGTTGNDIVGPPARLFIVEDNTVMRQALTQFLDDAPDFEVGGAVETAEEALQQLGDAANVDLVLIDTRLPGMSGIELVRRLQSQRPDLLCLMCSGHGETIYVDQALEAGARGYVLKGSPDELPGAIRRVLGGEQYFDSRIEPPASASSHSVG